MKCFFGNPDAKKYKEIKQAYKNMQELEEKMEEETKNIEEKFVVSLNTEDKKIYKDHINNCISESKVGGVVGKTVGGLGSMASILMLAGGSGSAITSGLAGIGALLGGGMVAGVGMIATAPIMLGFLGKNIFDRIVDNGKKTTLKKILESHEEFYKNGSGIVQELLKEYQQESTIFLKLIR